MIPQLTCRLPGMVARSPVRVVLDRHLRTAGSRASWSQTARETPLWVIASERADAPRRDEARRGRRAR